MTGTYTPPTYLSCAETEKLCRAALKSAFPEVKFSVRSSTYANGASIRVRWTDGPLKAEVEKIAGLYAGATFDGMIDLKSYHDSWLRDEDGEPQRVSFGADFVFVDRDISGEWKSEIFALFSRTIGRVAQDDWNQQNWPLTSTGSCTTWSS